MRDLALLVNRADGLSSSKRGEHPGGQRDYKIAPLVPVFQRVFVAPDPKSVLRYHPVFLVGPSASKDSVFPDQFQAYASDELEKTIQALGTQTKSVLTGFGGDFNYLTWYVLALLQIYTSTIPADTQQDVPDTSLYDHMKITAAIAACLYQTCETRSDWETGRGSDSIPAFFLLVGDVSGIQKYVFAIAGCDCTGRGVALESPSPCPRALRQCWGLTIYWT